MPADREKHYFPPGPIAKRFHQSKAFIRDIMGPVGSGKSTACVNECLRLSAIQPPQWDGVRRSRGAIIRNTYPDLEQTTIPTWLQWCPEEYNKMNWANPPSHHIVTRDLDIDVIFLALDREEDIRKLMGLELTWAWINESRFTPKAIIDALQGRVGRYPSVVDGGCTQPSILCDTNPPDSEHWRYKLAEHADPDMEASVEKARLELVKLGVLQSDQPLFEFFRQPGGLSAEAENIPNLRKGYYHFVAAGKSQDWIRVYVDGEYGFVAEGRPVYSMYRDSMHTSPVVLEPDPNLPLLLGIDLGLTPAATIVQRRPNGQWRVIAEFAADDCGLVRFAENLGKFLGTEFPGYLIGGGWLDPAGRARDTEERTAQDIFKAHIKCPWHYAPTNDFQPRREVVVSTLNRLIDGEPGMLVSPRAKMIREGFISKYHFKQKQSSNGADFHEIPVKNSYSHPHEALQYVVMGGGEYDVVLNKKDRERPQGKIADGTGGDPLDKGDADPTVYSQGNPRQWIKRTRDKKGRSRVAPGTEDGI